MTRVLLGILILTILATGAGAVDPDPLTRLSQRIPIQFVNPRQFHSDFTDPLGRFMDKLAAGAITDARAMRPAACAAWRASQHTTAVSGRFQVWDTMIDLNELCPPA